MNDNTGKEWLWPEILDALSADPTITDYYSKMT